MDTARTVLAADTVFLLREGGSGGTPALLLHGVPETSSCWRDVGPVLAATRRILVPDLPGLGGSTYSGPYDVSSLVGQLAALVDAEVAGPVDVVGHDWGGILGIGLAALRPDLVRRLVVANAPFRQPPPLYRAVHIPLFALPVAPELAFRLAGRRIVDLMLDLGWKARRPLDPERRAEYEAAYTPPEKVRAMLGYYRAAARSAARSAASAASAGSAASVAAARSAVSAGLPGARAAGRDRSGITAEAVGATGTTQPRPAGPVGAERLPDVATLQTLVLWGAADPVLPLVTGEAVVRDLGPTCRMVTVPGAGHFVIEEAPDIVADVLVEFLA